MGPPGTLSCPAEGPASGHEPERSGLPMSGLCLAGMNPLRPTGCAGDVLVVAGSVYGRHLDDDPACCGPAAAWSVRCRLGDLPCPGGWLPRKIRLNLWLRLLSARRPPCSPAQGGVTIRTARPAGLRRDAERHQGAAG
jgi:hypothetical protein